MKKATVAASMLFVLGFATTASAEEDGYTTQDDKDGYSVKFVDDLLDGGGLGATGPMITIRQQTVRVTLIRPRTSFVQELYKSVENI